MKQLKHNTADPLPVKTCPICKGYYVGSLEWIHPRCYRKLKGDEK